MSLSEQEQRALREIELSLMAEDPTFANNVRNESSYGVGVPSGKLTMRSVALMVLGLVLLIGGVALATLSLWTVALSVIGFGVMMAGGVMALRTPAGNPASVRPQAVAGEKSRSSRALSMEENFRRRFENGQ